ncbi:hypothetical protein [Humisphaera borealis]|uniref:Uncharacterized protein n=1 Tax=Humisphaera borealis TaxID=2807512 RepID=A0A7M2WZM3_9BACT|nr:hypothetical protein [Humisphaera borealis]QOV90889.1 hypothetical protein IPV69_05885 [Humisphaera borealis]
MITNATLTSHIARGASARDGTASWASPSTLTARCAVDAPRQAQRFTLGATIQDASGVIYVLKPAVAGVTIKAGDRLAATVDGSAGKTYQVVFVVDRQKSGGLSHLEIFVKE